MKSDPSIEQALHAFLEYQPDPQETVYESLCEIFFHYDSLLNDLLFKASTPEPLPGDLSILAGAEYACHVLPDEAGTARGVIPETTAKQLLAEGKTHHWRGKDFLVVNPEAHHAGILDTTSLRRFIADYADRQVVRPLGEGEMRNHVALALLNKSVCDLPNGRLVYWFEG